MHRDPQFLKLFEQLLTMTALEQAEDVIEMIDFLRAEGALDPADRVTEARVIIAYVVARTMQAELAAEGREGVVSERALIADILAALRAGNVVAIGRRAEPGDAPPPPPPSFTKRAAKGPLN